jgi:hypothetical protein
MMAILSMILMMMMMTIIRPLPPQIRTRQGGVGLPRKTLAQCRGEMRANFLRAYHTRRIALGADHPSTLEARRMVDSVADPVNWS